MVMGPDVTGASIFVISTEGHALTINEYHVEASANIVMVFTHVSETIRATWYNSNEGNDLMN